MRPNKIKQMWRAGQYVTMGWLSISHGFTAEVMARQGFDTLCIDMQHGTTEMNEVWPMPAAISQTDTVPVVQPWNDPHRHRAPTWRLRHHRAAGQHRRGRGAVAACRYPPVGMRSSARACPALWRRRLRGPRERRDRHHGHDRDEGRARQPGRHLRDPGLDAVYIGPSDLSFALGMAPRGDNPDPVHLATCDTIREAAHKHGIKAVMHCASAAFAAGAVKRGFDMVMLTSDLASMIAGARRQLDELKAATS